MQHFHRLLLVAVAIIALYLIKQRFDAGRKKEGFMDDDIKNLFLFGLVLPIIISILFVYIYAQIFKSSNHSHGYNNYYWK